MIIHDPNLMRLAVDPFENHPPLIVDPDRVKILEAALELLMLIASPSVRGSGAYHGDAACTKT
jgi:hypothetical protein